MNNVRTYWQDLLEVRQKLNLTQRQFAAYFGFPVATLRHWERGNRRPTGTALALLFVIREHPHAVMKAVKKARLNWPGCLPPIEPLRSYRAPPGTGARRERGLAAKSIRDRRERSHMPPKWPSALD
ncbi:hypothetical protein DSM104443_01547 [Usitatibacter rugosus]|uniref:HTH cro/C1-type domain-containing protein n=1 Tax=Usitatibacter rugosus TaxID=2732067 RepID=A0A6M4GVV5_9PROT|nr:helix-turn-helix domain-containing protein [Usitatibacter rugosus]QJR10483.1 hypothetical protein DSM104443_01547 [Usitatibacter rugosus]